MSLLLDRAPSRAAASPAVPAMGRDSASDRLRRFVGGRRDDAVVVSRDADELIALVSPDAPEAVVELTADGDRPGARIIAPTRSLDDTLARLDADLAARPAELVVVTAVSSVTGEVLPLGRFAAVAHRNGARILVVADRLVAHRAVSISSWGIDYLVFASHELDSLFAFHVLVGRSDRLAPSPLTPRRGTPAPGAIATAAVAASAEALLSLGFDELGYREQAIRHRLDVGIARLPGVRPVRTFDDHLDIAGAYAFAVDGQPASAVVDALSVRHGVGVCQAVAHPFGDPCGAVRVSTGLGTSADDVDRLLAALGGNGR
ncbi:aminotransferase class V-fold PLP-dependent enzyme [Gordonia hydrophobica]|uniref:Aminotransferase class V-fold PLP-dependent enzyme n=1 Tax=Gordonia hydrophobica TaxID=40516 RepID=A0ABZ2U6R3_9ACTN|nr:aminotransferase class V-fold PLP-dependent enzyme [Gordonia hydrophobica]MBM7366116.1 selenocysteine lyase/cysteine desulfurase [Gordonia hydrophobica]